MIELNFLPGKRIIPLHMKTSRLLLTFACCAATSLFAQEYRIQVNRPAKAGQEFQLSCRFQETHRISASFAGRSSPEQKTNYVAELDGLMRILETDSNGRIKRASCTISNCVRVEDRYKRELLPPRAVVTASTEQGKLQLLANGKSVGLETQKILAFGMQVDPDEAQTEEVFSTDTPRKVGDSWENDPEKLRGVLKMQRLGITSSDIQGRTTLEQVVKVGDEECLDLASKIYLKKFTPPLPPGVQIRQAFGALRLTGKFPVDASMAALEEGIEFDYSFVAQLGGATNAPGITTKTSSTVKGILQRKYLK
ncbi:MAG: hypothetical protein FJ398_14015 [Verrucomicrobia bacterium]|nr:hypothetical protein [Verrucomicrobiota bacterium]